MSNDLNYSTAIEDFRIARYSAGVEAVIARLRGHTTDLLSYDEVRQKLKAGNMIYRGLQEISLEAIIGSVGRYTDFTRSFLPRHDQDQNRWAKVKAAMEGLSGVPPIEVYQVGEGYFVVDGNHRVSVARQQGYPTIDAYVTEVQTKVPLTLNTSPDDLLIKAEYTDFLERTNLDQLRPEANLTLTSPGRYWLIDTQIEAHRLALSPDPEQLIPLEQAVTLWHDQIYRPVIDVIRRRGLLRGFPERTEADLFIWIFQHQQALQREFGWQIDPTVAADDLSATVDTSLSQKIGRLGNRLLNAVTPDELEAGAVPGDWRRRYEATRRNDRLFNTILVPLPPLAQGWANLDQAILLAQAEQGRLLAVHVLDKEADRTGEVGQAVQAAFNQKCEAAGISGELAFEVGRRVHHICNRGRWADLLVLGGAQADLDRTLTKLGSTMHQVVQRCSRPVMIVPRLINRLDTLLLAYDGSPKAEEAMFVTAYLAQRFAARLVLVTVIEQGVAKADTPDRAQAYLEKQGIQPERVVKNNTDVAEAILETATAEQADIIAMGGYGSLPLVEIVLGSAVDRVLRQADSPVLVCR